MAFLIDNKNISYSSYYKNLNDFIDSLPVQSQWFNRLDSGIGTTFLQTLSGHGVYLRNKATLAKREVFRFYAQNKSSLIASANDEGYSVFRGSNAKLKINVTPTSSFTIKKFDIIGTCKDVDIVALQTINVIKDIPVDINVILGTLQENIINIISSEINVFRFYDAFRVSDTARILLNDIEVPLTTQYVDLIKDFYLMQTNAFESVDVFYLNQDNFAYKYSAGDKLKLQYIELKDLAYTFPNDFDFFYGILNNFTLIKAYTIPEGKESIRVNTGLHKKTQQTVRGRLDFMEYLKILDTGFLDTNYRDLSGEQLELTYVKVDNNDNISYLTTPEKNALSLEVIKYNNMGIQPPPIIDGLEVSLELNIGINFNADYIQFYPNLASQGFVEDDVKEVLKYQHIDSWKTATNLGRNGLRQRKLKHKLDLWQIEHELKELPYVKIARVTIKTETWTASHGYLRGKFIKPISPNGRIYEARNNFISGLIEPDFNSVSANNFLIEGVIDWTANTPYSLNDFVLAPTNKLKIYKCVQAGMSNFIEPNFSVIDNNTFFDGTVVWQVIDPNEITGLNVWLCYDENSTEFQSKWKEFYKLSFSNIVSL